MLMCMSVLARACQRSSHPVPTLSRCWHSLAVDLHWLWRDLVAGVVVYFRIVGCPYARLGCQWVGQFSKLSVHEAACSHPHKTGTELMEPLRVIADQKQDEVKLYKNILDLMSCEKVVITGMKSDLHSCHLHQ